MLSTKKSPKKPSKSKLASSLDGQVNGLAFLLNNLPCRLTVSKNDDRHCRVRVSWPLRTTSDKPFRTRGAAAVKERSPKDV